MARGRRRQAPRRGYYWDGLQVGSTNIGSSGTVFELVNPVAQEFMPATLVRVRGYLQIANSGTDAANGGVQAAAKLMYIEVNDAGTITGDHQAIDTDEEDIAARQLWTWQGQLQERGAAADASDTDTVRIEVDVRVKLKLVASGKKILALLMDASSANRAVANMYLRCLLMHA